MLNKSSKSDYLKLKSNKTVYNRQFWFASSLALLIFVAPAFISVNTASANWHRTNHKNPASTPSPAPVPAPTPAPTPTPAPPAPAPPTPTPITTPTSVTVNGFGIAAGGGLMSLSQTQLNQYFDSLSALGTKWVRWDMDWSTIQSGGSTSFDWSGPDRVQQAATSRGINSLAIIDYAPKWAAAAGCVAGNSCAPADPNVYANFAGIVASRYKNNIAAWEIWNEPNLPMFWSPTPDATKYGAALKAAYLAIKQSNPSATVISGGLSPAEDANGRIAPLTFVQSLYTTGANKYFDGVAIHPYSFPVEPQYSATWNTWQQMDAIRQYMVGKGDANKKIWVTEYGAPTGGSGTAFGVNQLTYNYASSDFMSEIAQATMTQDVVNLYKQDSSWMGPLFWYSLKDNGSAKTSIENFFGLLRFDGSQKPAYNVYKSAISSLLASL